MGDGQIVFEQYSWTVKHEDAKKNRTNTLQPQPIKTAQKQTIGKLSKPFRKLMCSEGKQNSRESLATITLFESQCQEGRVTASFFLEITTTLASDLMAAISINRSGSLFSNFADLKGSKYANTR